MEAPAQILLAFRARSAFLQKHRRLPGIWDGPDAGEFIVLAAALNAVSPTPLATLDDQLLTLFSYTAQGAVGPMAAALGGWVAQEALKSLTGKFTPLTQLLCFDVAEICPPLDTPREQFQVHGDRYDAQRACLGADICAQLANIRLFMIGCGAIGCEMIKNYALLGLGTDRGGLITITDNDLIEKSNLNRQFLFRPRHIQKPKSTTAAEAASIINPQLRIDAHQHKVGPETAKTAYTDDFFQSLDVVVNALDNVQARLYVDSRCVTNQRPLLESGTMGAKGHVQVIVPHITESYASQKDPPEADVPYCTLKSFPSTIEHTIQWARDKFANLFELKPADFNKYWETNGLPDRVLAQLRAGTFEKSFGNTRQVVKQLRHAPHDWSQCVVMGRLKFEKYFNHKARQLLASFPLDTKLKDGSSFWASPKRPPTPLVYDSANASHLLFVASCARLLADVYQLPYTPQDVRPESVALIADHVHVPSFAAKGDKKIETDESLKKEDIAKQQDAATASVSVAEFQQYADEMAEVFATNQAANLGPVPRLAPLVFEKDADANGHIDFITQASVSCLAIVSCSGFMALCRINAFFHLLTLIFVVVGIFPIESASARVWNRAGRSVENQKDCRQDCSGYRDNDGHRLGLSGARAH